MQRIVDSTQTTAGLVQSYAWASTALGPTVAWPEALKLLVSIMMGSNQPMFLAWGPDLSLIYNDGYAKILADKHPAALGMPFLETWHEIRDDLVPIVDKAMSGQSVFMDDIELVLHRRGYSEETHFSFSYTPVRDASGAVVGIFCPCVETTDVVMSQRRLLERDREISEALAVQEGLLAQKDMLLAEVNHRVKNSLQLVVSALSLQSRRLTDASTKAAFEQAITRVKAITSVHERLYKSADPLVVEMRSYLQGLAEDLAGPTELRDRMRVEVDPISLRTERAIPVALIVNELVTNALKYAYPPGRPGPIELTLKKLEGGMLVLSVSDAGTGLSSTTTSGGLGTRLIASMAAQLGGDVDRKVKEDGYHVSVTFPRELT